MQRLGHYGVALCCYAPLGGALVALGRGEVALVGGLATVALSTLPDVDLRVPGMSHRGSTHTILFAVLVGVASGAIAVPAGEAAWGWTPALSAALGFAVGALSVCSHIAGDALTPMGVRPFWPLSGRRYSLSLTRAANPLANYLLLVVGIGVAGATGVVVAGTV